MLHDGLGGRRARRGRGADGRDRPGHRPRGRRRGREPVDPAGDDPATDRRQLPRSTSRARSARPGRPAAWAGRAGCWCTRAGSASRRTPTSSRPATTPRRPPRKRTGGARRRASSGTEPARRTLGWIRLEPPVPDRRSSPLAPHRRGVGRAARGRPTPAPAPASTSSTSAAAPAGSRSRSPGSATGSPSSTPARTRWPRWSAGPPRPASTVRAVQGDAAGLLDVVEPGSADLVLCHGVLEHVDDLAPRRRRPGRRAASRRHAQPARRPPQRGRARPGGRRPVRRGAARPRATRTAAGAPATRCRAGSPRPGLLALLGDAGLRVEAGARRPHRRRPRPRCRWSTPSPGRPTRWSRWSAAAARPAGASGPSRPSCTSARPPAAEPRVTDEPQPAAGPTRTAVRAAR